MSRLVARIVLASLIVPLAGLTAFVSVMLFNRSRPPSVTGVIAIWLFVDLVCGAYWIVLWHDVVRWTRPRVALTVASVPAALVAGVPIAVLLCVLPRSLPAEAATFVAGAVSAFCWVVATVFIWRETPAERAQRLAGAAADTVCCPVCGYNLTGMRELRCPECGARFTADELLRAQPQRDRGALTVHD